MDSSYSCRWINNIQCVWVYKLYPSLPPPRTMLVVIEQHLADKFSPQYCKGGAGGYLSYTHTLFWEFKSVFSLIVAVLKLRLILRNNDSYYTTKQIDTKLNISTGFTMLITLYFSNRPKNANAITTLSTPWRTGHPLTPSQTTAWMRCSGVSLTCQRKDTSERSGAINVTDWKYLTISRKSFVFCATTQIPCSWVSLGVCNKV